MVTDVTGGGSSTPRMRNSAFPAIFSGDLHKSFLKSEQVTHQHVPTAQLTLTPELAQGVASSYRSGSGSGSDDGPPLLKFHVNDPSFNTRPNSLQC
jgi:hypothetical protein